ncbi:hypothetical protein DRQ00_09725 [candidate division KSB1 bacterium]|nr:MAG: hypothetical protein DRQ00_09725 [candidate division KSB1 bacterium]RKY88758.1 MAG: hypothetical protein DRQ11_02790 [candidate division KSB1 bacterium]
MKSKIVISVIVILPFLATTPLFAQEKQAKSPKCGWQKEIVGGLNLNQTSFDNWAQGGENSFAWQVNLNLKFVNDQEKTTWSNSGKFSYGQTKSGKEESRKSIDEIKLESVLRYKFGTYANPYVAVTAETQFTAGYDYGTNPRKQISAFLDPGYFRQSVGIGYQPPNNIVKTRLGVALKQTITHNYPSPYADDPKTKKIEKIKSEIGAESVTDVSWKISENIIFTSKLELFSGLKALDETDVNWDNVFTAKISKYFNVNFNVKLFYDKDISKKRQLKQSLAMGLTCSFL